MTFRFPGLDWWTETVGVIGHVKRAQQGELATSWGSGGTCRPHTLRCCCRVPEQTLGTGVRRETEEILPFRETCQA